VDGVDDDTRGSYFFDSFASQSSGYIGLEPDGAIPELFEDGFENGNYLAWSSSLTEGGSLEVNSQAAIDGEYGLQTTISTMNSVYLRNNSTPTMEYHARFYFDPNSISMADGDEHTILKLEDEEGWIVARIDFSYQDDDYWVRSVAMLDDDEEFIGDWVMLSDDQHKIEMGWYASGEPEYDEGFVVFWLDDEIQYYLDYLDNDTLRTTTVKLGAVEGVDDDTRGSYYFDAFVSGRNGDIGMLIPGNIFMGMVDSEAQSQQLLAGLEAAQKTLAAPAPVQPETSLATAQQSQLISTTMVISYTYDPLNRLTAADYDGGMYFHYTYDAVGNRLVEATNVLTNTYSYDDANRMIYFNSVNYTWDDNGNLLSDGVNSYSYDRANRLIEVSGVGVDVSYAYNGLGDRLSETANSQTTHYTMDLNAGLTQVLQDGTNTYQYGLDRIAQYSANGPEYYLADALGSVRQMVDANGNVTMGRMYKPYGGVLSSTGRW
jgi:YD repeat-containing protein